MSYIIPVLTFVFGFVAEKLFEIVMSWLNKKRMLRKIEKKIHKNRVTELDTLNILTLDSGIPEFNPSDPSDIIVKSTEFLLGFSKKHTPLLSDKKRETFESIDSIPSQFSRNLKVIIGEDYIDMIDKHREIISEQFALRKNGLFFNSDKYGVLNSSFDRTSDTREMPVINMDLYQTDYFTHQVMTSIMNELKLDKKKLSHGNLLEYTPFRTSLGLSILVVLPLTDEVIMSVRMKGTAFTGDQEWVYVSATEAIGETDLGSHSNEILLKQAVSRALGEELGIREHLYQSTSIHFYDVFFERNFFQDNIVSVVYLNDDVHFDEVRTLKARDKNMEVNNLFTIKINEIKSYIDNNTEKMRPQTIYTLQSFLSHR